MRQSKIKLGFSDIGITIYMGVAVKMQKWTLFVFVTRDIIGMVNFIGKNITFVILFHAVHVLSHAFSRLAQQSIDEMQKTHTTRMLPC